MTGREIRRVDVELLRRGGRENQLLSKYTDYLAVCGSSPSDVVHVPVQHAQMLRILDDLRYEVHRESTAQLDEIRDELGADLAHMLAGIPGLVGQLAERPNAEKVHIRLTMSAAELALLPFEMARMPMTPTEAGDGWLLSRPGEPFALTRHVRGIPPPQTPSSTTPRILFISGNDVPFDDHLRALLEVLEPWHGERAPDFLATNPERPEHLISPYLTVLRDTNLEAITSTVRSQHFTHVHLLAHGLALEGRRELERFGIELGGRLVTGEDLASALSVVDKDRPSPLPDVVTLAACDSAGQSAVTTNGGSIAFELHTSGIPLVVASQFPISEAASLPFVQRFYEGQLRGDHPLETIGNLRKELKTQFDYEHAWASLVVYESLQETHDDHLEELSYRQARRARDRALDDLKLAAADGLTKDEFDHLVDRVVTRVEALPASGAYESESWGLRAAAYKIVAEHSMTHGDSECLSWLDKSEAAYVRASLPVVRSSQHIVQRIANTHWLVGQIVSLQSVLGRPIDRDALGAARYSALRDLAHDDRVTKAWANVSLLELTLLRAAADEDPDTASVVDRVEELATDIISVVGETAEPVVQTAIQMRRYVDWFTSDAFAALLAANGRTRAATWDTDGAVATIAAAAATALGWKAVSDPTAPTAIDEPEEIVDFTAHVAPLPNDVRVGTFDIELLRAGNGDCLWISYGDETKHYVMIDCGSRSAVDDARDRILSVDEVELFVMTHIDADHISGAIPLLEDHQVLSRLRHVWFNGRDQLRGFLSVKQGEVFTKLLQREDRHYLWNEAKARVVPPAITTEDPPPEIELPGGLRLTVLSPTSQGLGKLAVHWNAALRPPDRFRKLGRRPRPEPVTDPASFDLEECAASGSTKDSSVPNMSSIAFVAEYGGRAVLFTGDAHADVLVESIRAMQKHRGREGTRLRLDALKLSHHGSASATTKALLDEIDCRRYIVTSNGKGFYHPDRPAIARVLVHGGPEPELYFNYRTDLNELWANDDLQENNSYTAHYPEDENTALSVEL